MYVVYTSRYTEMSVDLHEDYPVSQNKTAIFSSGTLNFDHFKILIYV